MNLKRGVLLFLLTAGACAGRGPRVSLINETGAALRDVWVGEPGGRALDGAPLHSLAAGAAAALPLRGDPAKLSVQYRMKSGQEVERTVLLPPRAEGASVSLTLRPDGGVSARSRRP